MTRINAHLCALCVLLAVLMLHHCSAFQFPSSSTAFGPGFRLQQLHHRSSATAVAVRRRAALLARPKRWYELGPGETLGSSFGSGDTLGPPPDLPSMLLEQRMLYLPSILTPQASEVVIAQLLYLNNENTDAPIQMFINSLGSQTNSSTSYASYYDTSAFSIVDTMRYIHCPVHTSVVGQALGSAAMILAAGAKGHRTALPHAAVSLRVMPPPLSGRVKNRDMLREEVEHSRKAMAALVAETCGKDAQQVLNDITNGPLMSAREAQQYGLIDRIEQPQEKTRPLRTPTTAFVAEAQRVDTE